MSGLAQLSCQQCQRRKTKCDKTHPCSACARAGIKCTAVQRHRLPRGRTAKQNVNGSQALKGRVEQLEAIVSKLQREGTAAQSPAPMSSSHTVPLDHFVATDFWTELSDAVAGIKDVLEQDEDDLDEDEGLANMNDSSPSSTSRPYTTNNSGSEAGLFGYALSPPRNEVRLTEKTKHYLMQVYKERVDSIFKPLHWPSSLAAIQAQSTADAEASADIRALELSILFAAACSLFDHELENRLEHIEHLRRAVEQAFVRARILTTISIVALQAFVVYLAGLRASRANAEQWTLVAIAIRLANAQGIPARLDGDTSSFDMDVRRRLWQCIAVLDLQSALDRGTQPLIKSTELQSVPLNVNDDSLSSRHVLDRGQPDEAVFTDMTYSLSIYRGNVCQRQLTEIGSSQESAAAKGHKQLEILADFERHTQRLATICDDSPLQSFTLTVTTVSLDTMRLLLYRPLYKREAGFVPIGHGLDIETDILGAATTILEQSLMKRTQYQFAPWVWFTWVKWFVLAVVLAELCTARGTQADHAWKVAQQSYDDYANIVADTHRGLLWKPIAKLMRKVRALREGYNGGVHLTSSGRPKALETYNMSGTGASETSELQIQSLSPPNPAEVTLDHFNNLGFGDADFMVDMEGIEETSWLQWDQLIQDLNDNTE